MSKEEEEDFHDRTKKVRFNIEEEQLITGKEMDNAFIRELNLRNNIDEFDINDYTKILYRLPIRNDVLEKIHKDIINNNNK